ncbi:MAG: serine/threonine-protein kinase [Clostridium butyricum]|nr:serine/threonine-protein kinase [Clostridium butyricum]MDU5820953.1 serine/threonine-protein kinase [Clostridium butyricum]
MPKAIPYKDIILNHNLDIKVKMDIIRNVALILNKIHEKGYAHRDIKLDNLLFYNEKFVFSDFGLVSNTDYEQITKINESIGPWNSIAPEMKRHAYEVKDARPADVYSFAKIIWIILTEDEKCFHGQYEKDKSFGLKHSDFNIESLECIHELLKKSTDDDMYNRPNIEEVISLIDKWIDIISDKNKIRDEKRQIYRENIRKRYIPNDEIYKDLNKILDIIKDIFKLYSINGINFGEIYPRTFIKSKIVNCIEINDGKNTFIIKQVKLVVKNNDLNNFTYILETEDIEDKDFEKIDDEYIKNENMSFIDDFLGRSFNIGNTKKIILLGEKDIRFKPY